MSFKQWLGGNGSEADNVVKPISQERRSIEEEAERLGAFLQKRVVVGFEDC